MVVGSDGKHVGTVDHLEGEGKLTRQDSGDGHHHFIPVDWVSDVDEMVHLGKGVSACGAPLRHLK